jgi:hypothetical protein
VLHVLPWDRALNTLPRNGAFESLPWDRARIDARSGGRRLGRLRLLPPPVNSLNTLLARLAQLTLLTRLTGLTRLTPSFNPLSLTARLAGLTLLARLARLGLLTLLTLLTLSAGLPVSAAFFSTTAVLSGRRLRV